MLWELCLIYEVLLSHSSKMAEEKRAESLPGNGNEATKNGALQRFHFWVNNTLRPKIKGCCMLSARRYKAGKIEQEPIGFSLAAQLTKFLLYSIGPDACPCNKMKVCQPHPPWWVWLEGGMRKGPQN